MEIVRISTTRVELIAYLVIAQDVPPVQVLPPTVPLPVILVVNSVTQKKNAGFVLPDTILN